MESLPWSSAMRLVAAFLVVLAPLSAAQHVRARPRDGIAPSNLQKKALVLPRQPPRLGRYVEPSPRSALVKAAAGQRQVRLLRGVAAKRNIIRPNAGSAEPYVSGNQLPTPNAQSSGFFPAVGDIARLPGPGNLAEYFDIGQIKSLRYDKTTRKWMAQIEPFKEFANGYYDIARDTQWKQYDVSTLTPVAGFFIQAKNSWKVWSRTRKDLTEQRSEPITLLEGGYDLPAEPMFMPDVDTGRSEDVDEKSDFNKKLDIVISDVIEFKLPVVAETLLYGGLGAAAWFNAMGDEAAQLYALGVAAGVAYVILLGDGGGPARIAIPALLIASVAKRNANLEGLDQWVGTDRTFSLVQKDQFLSAITGFFTFRLPLFRRALSEAAKLLTDISTPIVQAAPKLDPATSAPRAGRSTGTVRRKASDVGNRLKYSPLRDRKAQRNKDEARRRQTQLNAPFIPEMPPSTTATSPAAGELQEEGGDDGAPDLKPINVVYVSGPPGYDSQRIVQELCNRDTRLKQPQWVTDAEGPDRRNVKAVSKSVFDEMQQDGMFVVEDEERGVFGLGNKRYGLQYQDIEAAALGGYSCVISAPLLTDPLPSPPTPEPNAPQQEPSSGGQGEAASAALTPQQAPLRGVGLLALPDTQSAQEQALSLRLDELLTEAESRGLAEGIGGSNAVDRKVAVRQKTLSILSGTDEWVKEAASSAQYQFAVTDFPDNDKGLSNFLDTLGKFITYS